MSTLKAELQKVHPIPLIRRVWRLVKDKPEVTATALASILKESPAQVSSALSELYKRDMVIRSERRNRSNRREYTYTVPSKQAEYELLPRVRDLGGKRKTTTAKKSEAAVVEVVKVAPQTANIWDRWEIDKLTIAEGRQLYQMLERMFGDEKP